MAQQTDGIAAGQANSRGEPGEQWKEPGIVGYRTKALYGAPGHLKNVPAKSALTHNAYQIRLSSQRTTADKAETLSKKQQSC